MNEKNKSRLDDQGGDGLRPAPEPQAGPKSESPRGSPEGESSGRPAGGAQGARRGGPALLGDARAGSSLGRTLTLARGELLAFWSSPSAGLALAVFLGLTGLNLYNCTAAYSAANLQAMARGGGLSAEVALVAAALTDLGLVLALVTPLTTMRAFAPSSAGGSADLLLAWPLSRAELTLGQHLAAWTSLGLLSLLGLVPFAALAALGAGSPAVLASAALGLVLAAAAFAAVGLAAAALTRAPLSAALTTLGALGFFWAVGWAAPFLPPRVGALVQGLAFQPRLGHFALGLLDLNDVVHFLALTAAALWLCRPVRDR
jgi:ABC-2 type transport system permease protein